MTPTETSLLELFERAGAARAADDGLDYRFLEDESLDSFARISLCLEIEGEFGIEIRPEELLDERGRDARALAALIDARRPSAAGGA